MEIELEKIFEKANKNFLEKNLMLFEMCVSERTLCGALMIELHEIIKSTQYNDYFVDVEYNRNLGGKVKTFRKTIEGPSEEIIPINCDLIVHSRGQNIHQDNLIALEMKKSTSREVDKEKDKIRLECLTKEPRNEVWGYPRNVLPEHICGYGLGIYYEIDFKCKKILVEYYRKGYKYKQYILDFNCNLLEN